MTEQRIPVLPADHDGVVAAVDALRSGRCIGIPTDTVYGVSAALSHPRAVERLFELKGRAATKAMAVLVGSTESAYELGEFAPHARAVVERFWPGPLTTVVRRVPALRIDLGGDPATIGIRYPDSALVAAIVAEVGPIVTTSANRSGAPTLATAEEIAGAFDDRLALVLDGGALRDAASTVVDLSGPGIDVLREGPITITELLGAI